MVLFLLQNIMELKSLVSMSLLAQKWNNIIFGGKTEISDFSKRHRTKMCTSTLQKLTLKETYIHSSEIWYKKKVNFIRQQQKLGFVKVRRWLWWQRSKLYSWIVRTKERLIKQAAGKKCVFNSMRFLRFATR